MKIKQWFADTLLAILNWFDPPERLTVEQMQSLKRELEGQSEIKIWPDARTYTHQQQQPVQPPTAAYDAPSPTTEGKIAAAKIRIPYRTRQATRDLSENHGLLMRHHKTMKEVEQKSKASDPSHTEVLDKVPHKYNLMIHGEPLPDEDDTLHSAPAWINDRTA